MSIDANRILNSIMPIDVELTLSHFINNTNVNVLVVINLDVFILDHLMQFNSIFK